MNSQEQLLQDKSFFDNSSLIYKTICWTLIICFTWEQLVQAAPAGLIPFRAQVNQASTAGDAGVRFIEPTTDKKAILDKVESLVNEGVDLSSLNQREEKYITGRGYSAIEQIKQMRQDQENLRRKQLIEYKRQYASYESEQIQKQRSFRDKYDSYVIQQDLNRIMEYAAQKTYNASPHYVPDAKDPNKIIWYQRGVVVAVLNEKITLPDGSVEYEDTVNMKYNDKALLAEYTVLRHNAPTDKNFYDFSKYDPYLGVNKFTFDPDQFVALYGYITEEHHFLTYTPDSVHYASKETNAVKQIQSHYYTTRTYGTAQDTWLATDSYEHNRENLQYDNEGNLIGYTEYISDESGKSIGMIEVSDILYDPETGEMLTYYSKVYQIDDSGKLTLIDEGITYVSDSVETAYSVETVIQDGGATINDIYRDKNGDVIYEIIRTNCTYDGGGYGYGKLIEFVLEKKNSTGDTIYKAHFNLDTDFGVAGEDEFGRRRYVGDGIEQWAEKEYALIEIRNIDGSLAEETTASVELGGTISITTAIYDNGKCISKTSRNEAADGTLLSLMTVDYYYNGDILEQYIYGRITYSATGELSTHVTSTINYNAEGKKIYYESRTFSSGGQLGLNTTDYRYGQDGDNTYVIENQKYALYQGAVDVNDDAPGKITSETWYTTKRTYNANTNPVETLRITVKDSGEVFESITRNDYENNNLMFNLQINNNYQILQSDVEGLIIYTQTSTTLLLSGSGIPGLDVPQKQTVYAKANEYETYTVGLETAYRQVKTIYLSVDENENVTRTTIEYAYNNDYARAVVLTISKQYNCGAADVASDIINYTQSQTPVPTPAEKAAYIFNYDFSSATLKSANLTYTHKEYGVDANNDGSIDDDEKGLLRKTITVTASDNGSATERISQHGYNDEKMKIVTSNTTKIFNGSAILYDIEAELRRTGDGTNVKETSSLDDPSADFDWINYNLESTQIDFNRTEYEQDRIIRKVTVTVKDNGEATETTMDYSYDLINGKRLLGATINRTYNYGNSLWSIETFASHAQGMIDDCNDGNSATDPADYDFQTDIQRLPIDPLHAALDKTSYSISQTEYDLNGNTIKTISIYVSAHV